MRDLKYITNFAQKLGFCVIIQPKTEKNKQEYS